MNHANFGFRRGPAADRQGGRSASGDQKDDDNKIANEDEIQKKLFQAGLKNPSN